MIKVVAKMKVKKDRLEDFLEVGKKLVPASKADEGNIGYTLNVSADDPCCYAMIENWKDKASLDAHMQTEHFKTAMAAMADMLEEETSIELYTEV